MDVRIRLVCLIGVLFCVGCQDKRTPTLGPKPKAVPKLDVQSASAVAADLPRSRQTKDAALLAEIDLLAVDKGLPSQIDQDAAPANDARTIHARLSLIFSKVPLLVDELDPLVPTNGFNWSADALRQARKFTAERQQTRREVRKLLAGEQGPRLIAADASSSDLAYVDVWRIAHRLELFAAADALAADNLTEAVASFDAMTAMCERLSREAVVAARAEAARLRVDNSRLLQAICDHSQLNSDTLQRLRKITLRQANALPGEAIVWKGDRVAGLAVYEAVRRGELMTVLPLEDIERLTDEKRLEVTKKSIARGIDLDQRTYMELMRELIIACDQGPAEANRVASGIKTKLESWREGSDFPYIAAKLLLTDVPKAHELFAQDQALCDAWSMALEYAASNVPPRPKINAFTGKPFDVQATKEEVTIRGVAVQSGIREIRVSRQTSP
jgi:hypothetical protein